MSQESIYSQGRYRGGASSRSETNRSRSSTISTISKHENYNTSLISSPSQDHDSTHPKAELPSAESTSLLGSVWNLVRDAKELAAREVDKLLESFPYRSISKASTASQSGIHDKIKTRESSLAVKKPRVGSSSEPPKSLLGRGPPVKVRGQHSSHIKKNHALSRKLLSSDVKDHVNDVSPSVHLRTPLPMSKRVSGISSSIEPIKRMRHSSEFEFELESSPERSPPMQYRRTPSLKRDLSESSLSSIQAGQGTIHDSDWTSSEERRRQEHIDHSEYTAKKHDRDTESSPRPNSSPTPSITSMARSLSIVSHSHAHTDLPHRPHSRQRLHAPHRRRPHYVHHQRHNSNTSPVRNSLLGGPLEATSSHDDFIEPVPAPVAIYPSSPSISREGSAIEGKIDSMPMLSSTSTTVGSMNNPFVVTKGLSPLPPSLLADTTPERTSGSPKISSTPDNDKLQELQHELALIKEQLASLVSARNGEIGRTQSSPAYLNSSNPPPPPPPPPLQSNQINPKKWSPPNNQASLSMMQVLKELSSSKVQLRKTGSPFVSQISAAVDGASSSGYTSLAIRSKDELVAGPNKSSSPTTPIPSTSINSISKSFPSKMNPNTNPATSIESKEDDYIHTTIVKDPQWPSSVTLRKANSRLDQAGRELLVGNKLGREQTIDLFSPYPRTYNGKYTDDPESFDPSPSSSRGSNRTQNIANNDSSPNIPSGSFKKNSTTPTNTTAIIDSNGRTRARPPLTINKNARPAHPRTRKIQRSMTDPMQLTQHLQPLNAKEPNGSRKHVSFESAEEGEDETDDFNKDNHRWFRGPDIDSWRVGS